MSALTAEEPHFFYTPDPAMPGWWTWDIKDAGRFNATLGPLRVRGEADGRVRLRMIPARRHTNPNDTVHGGALMAVIDIALFATCRVRGLFHVGAASTVDCHVQFVAAARIDLPLDIVGEVLRETGRMVFLRGLAVQGADDAVVCCAFSGTVRKPPPTA